jgi:hypothetical protein
MRNLITVAVSCWLLVSCQPAAVPPDHLVRTGNYLGETPPGETPAIFAEGLVSTSLDVRDTTWGPDGDELYYTLWARNRGTVVTVRRMDGVWGEARNMGEPFNSPAIDFCPALSRDGEFFFWTSGRTPEGLPPPAGYDELVRQLSGHANGSMNLYWVSADLLERLKANDPG